MQTKQKSVYPIHKFDIAEQGEICTTADSSSIHSDCYDFRINPYYFDQVIPDKPVRKYGFKGLSKPHEIQKHTLPLHQEQYVINQSKIDSLVKLNIYDDNQDALILEINKIWKS